MSKRAEIIISLAILAGTGLVMAMIINFGVDRKWVEDIGVYYIMLLLFLRNENWKQDFRSLRNLGPRGKVLSALTVLASLSFLIVSIVTVVRDGNSPMTYVFIAVVIPLVVSLAFRILAKPHEAQ